jgi:hypothetical protein
LKRRQSGRKEFARLRLITDGKTLHKLTDDPAVLEDVLSNGQLVFSIIAVGQMEEALRAKLVKIDKEASGVKSA